MKDELQRVKSLTKVKDKPEIVTMTKTTIYAVYVDYISRANSEKIKQQIKGDQYMHSEQSNSHATEQV